MLKRIKDILERLLGATHPAPALQPVPIPVSRRRR